MCMCVCPHMPGEDEEKQPKHYEIILYQTALSAKSFVTMVTPQGKHCCVYLFWCACVCYIVVVNADAPYCQTVSIRAWEGKGFSEYEVKWSEQSENDHAFCFGMNRSPEGMLHIKRKTIKGGKKRERTLQRSHPSLQMTVILILAACLCVRKLYVLQLLERWPTLDCTAVCTSIKVEGAVRQDTVWPAITAAVLVGRYTFPSIYDAVLWVVSLKLIQIWAIVTLF